MNQTITATLKETWNAKRWFRILLIATLIWTALRIGLDAYIVFSGTEGQAGVDQQVYTDAAQSFAKRADLYPTSLESLENQYPYPPVFALLSEVLLILPSEANIIISSLLHILTFCALYFIWWKIFQYCKLDKAAQALILTIPLWLMFSPFWDDLSYLNIYTIMALLGSLLIYAVLKEDLWQAVPWLVLILITKPMWAFAAAVPLLLGHAKDYRFFAKLILWSLGGYVLLAGITFLVGGPAYIYRQYQDYIQLLLRLGNDFPWRGPDSGFMGYNHSMKQIIAYYVGKSASTLRLATLIKVILLVPLVAFAIKTIFKPKQQRPLPETLEIAFLFYLGAFIWLDILWEAFLSIAIFTYLISVSENKTLRGVIYAVFLPYALLDIYRVVLYVANTPMVQDSYLLWDFSIFVPIIMIVIVTFYAILLVKVFRHG
jgi:hypothetical protein